MEMCYGEALVMPSNYSMMSEEEMTYVEGGYYMNHEDCNAWRFAIGATISTNASVFMNLVCVHGVVGITAPLSGLPVVGWLIAIYGAAIIIKSAENIVSAFMKEAIYKKGIDVTIEFSWGVPYLGCSART